MASGGLKSARKRGQGYNTSGFSRYRITNGLAANIFTGDLVKLSSTGMVQPATAASATAVAGVFMGCRYVDPTSQRPTWSKYWPTGTSSVDATPYAFVDDDPSSIFEITCDATVTAGDIEVKNFNINASAGSTVTGQSGFDLDVGSRTTGGAQLRIVDKVDTPDNTFSSANPKVLVRVVGHIDAFVTAGISATV